MAEIMEVMEDIKKGIGDKGFYILIACAGAFGLYNLLKGSGSESSDSSDLASTRIVTSVSSYPDAVTNANVIIDSIQNSIDYSEGVITDKIDGLDTSMKDYLEENFEATNDYINKGLESQKDLLEKNFDELKGSIADTQENIQSGFVNANDLLNDLKNAPSGAISKNTAKDKPKKNNVGKGATSKVKAVKTSGKTSGTYKYKTKAGYNTSTSIMDAMKVATGNYDTKETQETIKKVAKANGISNYTGTYNQNVSLLSKLKTGKLKKA